uniref:Uncharacterized protein n=1 Tax=Arundo donax TaxID=35708 RepID=A0A0A9BP86_ARUDO
MICLRAEAGWFALFPIVDAWD